VLTGVFLTASPSAYNSLKPWLDFRIGTGQALARRSRALWGHTLEKGKQGVAASLRSATNSYWIFGAKTNWRFRWGKENYL